MPRVKVLGTISSRTTQVEDDDRSSLNESRRQRMLRELGCTPYPSVDSINSYVNRDSDRSARSLGLLLEAQLEVERRLRAEAIKLAEAIKKAWEEAEARTRIRIAFRFQAERKSPDAAGTREEAQGGAEKMIDAAGRAHAEAINRALAEMMARVQAEQQAITEKRVRAVVEYLAKDETVELVSQKRGVLYKVLFHSRNRLTH